jgi:2-amino-4-hydroxy-6-hydroxymethyldihydropteridine diphosphokinase
MIVQTGSAVYIGVGSNIDPCENIKAALALLKTYVTVTAISPFYRSRAVGSPHQPDFVNGIFRIAPTSTPRELKFEVLRVIEDRLGRVRTTDKNSARMIDLDIVLFGKLTISEPDLVIPDPGLLDYPFVGIPLLDLEPELVVPGTGEKLKSFFPKQARLYKLKTIPAFSRELARLL